MSREKPIFDGKRKLGIRPLYNYEFLLPLGEPDTSVEVNPSFGIRYPNTAPNTTVHHPHLLAQHISKLYGTGAASDCTLVSRDSQEFPAHRAILTAWSPVFTAMFTVNMAEKVSGVCKMENFDGKVIEAMLKFIYTGTLSGIGEFVEEVLDMAEQYDMPDLNTATQEFMKKDVTVKNAAGYFHLADRWGLRAKGKLAGFIGQHQREF